MALRIRLTVEYDADIDDSTMTESAVREYLVQEKEAWLQGEVDVHDVITVDDSAVFTLVNI